MLLSESYKNRLKELAGIIKLNEDWPTERPEFFGDENAVPFNKELMKKAIENGLEVVMNFKSNNSKYKMPVHKTRRIQPVAMGYDKKGNLVIRGYHINGQSEKEAIRTGVRSAEVKNEWRLFKSNNISKMWLNGKMFDVAPPGTKTSDKAMVTILARFNPTKAKRYQNSINNNDKIKPVNNVEKSEQDNTEINPV